MISKKTLKDYEFKNINEYYDYIIDSYINGNFSQFKELILKGSKEQKQDFYNWLINNLCLKSDLIDQIEYKFIEVILNK